MARVAIHFVSRSTGKFPVALMAGFIVIASLARPIVAAPLPPMAPVDACGEIQSLEWLPSETLPAVPGMSGSAGRKREWPARFVAVLGNVQGLDEAQIAHINALLSSSSDSAGVNVTPDGLLLVLPIEDPDLLKRGVGICVTGFVVRGDEGGTWTKYDKLELVDRDCGSGCK
jgi:hypothetical protein